MYALVRPLVLALVFAASGALAAPSLVDSRVAHSQADAALQKVHQRQATLTRELDAESGRAAALKAESKGKLLEVRGLQTSLRRSQELSTELSALAQQEAANRAARNAATSHLIEAITAEMTRLQAQWDAASAAEARRQLVENLRALRLERETLRTQSATGGVPTPPASSSDDPAELMAQSDALRDAEDKARARMAVLDTRIGELRKERDLDRRMSDFLHDESLLDENDRRVSRGPRSADGQITPFSSGGNGPLNSGPEPGTAAAPPGVGTNSAGEGPRGLAAAAVDDRRPQVNHAPRELNGSGEDDLEQILKERAALEEKAKALHRAAIEAEAKAKAAPTAW